MFHSEVHEYIPADGFPHTPKNMDCPCKPELVVIPYIGGGIVHRRVDIPDTFPEKWIDNVDPPLNG